MVVIDCDNFAIIRSWDIKFKISHLVKNAIERMLGNMGKPAGWKMLIFACSDRSWAKLAKNRRFRSNPCRSRSEIE
eukprot:1548249-Amphidinium_carterae.1